MTAPIILVRSASSAASVSVPSFYCVRASATDTAKTDELGAEVKTYGNACFMWFAYLNTSTVAGLVCAATSDLQ